MTTIEALKLAIKEAYKGAPFVSPNPLVGCVILDSSGEILSTGFHQKYGEAHAEVNALQGLSLEQLTGAHVIVTLEPCAHQGKTPSCAKTLATLPIKKVTFGLLDPNPLVAGQGAQILRDAGIEVNNFSESLEDPELVRELEEVCEVFLWNFRSKKIFVALKMATTLDGMIGLKNGESKWITGPESRQQVHYLRSTYDAVLVGRGTVEADDPELNIRHPEIKKQNKVIVLDSEAKLLERFSQLKIFKAHDPENIFWVVAESFKNETLKKYGHLGLKFIFVARESGKLNLKSALEQLYDQGIRSLMIEGGASVAQSFLQEGLVQRLWLFMAPSLLGGVEGRLWTNYVNTAHIKDKILLDSPKTQAFGVDICWTGRLKP